MTQQQASLVYQATLHVAASLHAAVIKMEKVANLFPALTPTPVWMWIALRKRQATEHLEAAEALALEYGL
jgi:hypothetical protein